MTWLLQAFQLVLDHPILPWHHCVRHAIDMTLGLCVSVCETTISHRVPAMLRWQQSLQLGLLKAQCHKRRMASGETLEDPPVPLGAEGHACNFLAVS